MKLWAPVGLVPDANGEALSVGVCTFGFTTPFSVLPLGESEWRGGPNYSQEKLYNFSCASSLASFWPCVDIG